MELGRVFFMISVMSSSADSHRAQMTAYLSYFNFIPEYLPNKYVFKLLEAGSVTLKFLPFV